MAKYKIQHLKIPDGFENLTSKFTANQYKNINEISLDNTSTILLV